MTFCTNFVCNGRYSQTPSWPSTIHLLHNRRETQNEPSPHTPSEAGVQLGYPTGRWHRPECQERPPSGRSLPPYPIYCSENRHPPRQNKCSLISQPQYSSRFPHKLFVYWPKLCFTVNIWKWGEAVKEGDPWLQHQNIIYKACCDAAMLRLGSPVFCQMQTAFLRAEHGPVPSVWYRSPTFWPPA